MDITNTPNLLISCQYNVTLIKNTFSWKIRNEGGSQNFVAGKASNQTTKRFLYCMMYDTFQEDKNRAINVLIILQRYIFAGVPWDIYSDNY